MDAPISSDLFIPVARVDEVPEKRSKAVDAFGRSVLLCRTQGNIYAVANECSHQGRPLAGGRVQGTFIFCPTHGARYCLLTGIPSGNLTQRPLRTYATRVKDGWIELSESPDLEPGPVRHSSTEAQS
jgi:3-phenylpropionate/trans-cinnamate dioxygenase ferredoxin subunit